MSEKPDKDQKTEDPTDKKLEDARTKGQVASAPETKHAAMFLAALIVVGGLGGYSMQRLALLFVRLWGNADDYMLQPQGAENFAIGLTGAVGMAVLPLFGSLFVFAILGGFLQGRPTLSWTRVAPKWSKLNPIAGFGRMFGTRALVEFAKTLFKLSAVCLVALWVIWPKAGGLDHLIGIEPGQIGSAATAIVFDMLKAIALLVLALSLFDVFWQRYSFHQQMKMSKQEVKDEHKQQEGDPKIKGRIRSIQIQRAKKRMMANVPKASVIITNPTHYAVALQYDHGQMAAPLVVAKGVDAIALKIREIAGQHDVPIVENRPLARALYASAEVDRPIPTEHYAAVAEIISYVLRLARMKRGG